MAEWMEKLRKLEELRADSLITDEEYEKQKALLIPSNSSAASIYNLRGFGIAISILSGLSALCGLLTIFTHLYRASLTNDLKNGIFVSWSTYQEAERWVSITRDWSLILSGVLLVLLLLWAWRAAGNIESLGRPGRWSRGWAIGGWFTPIMFFFVPYQIISDAWKNTSDDQESIPKRNKFWLAAFILFWVTLIIRNIGSAVAPGFDYSGSRSDYADDAIAADTLWAIGGASFLIYGIVMAIAFNQMSKRHA